MGEGPEPTEEAPEEARDEAPGRPAGEPDQEPRKPRRPSPPWYGAIASLALLLSVLWLLSYTLLDWDWQQGLGAWNYLIALVLSSVPGRMLQHWHGEPHRE